MKRYGALLIAILTLVSSTVYGKTMKVNVQARTQEEIKVLSMTIEDLYSNLPKNQQKLIRRGLFFVVYYEEGPFTKVAQAFGPEDDPVYKYPDRALYPQGTIKVNIMPHTLDFMRLYQALDDLIVQSVLRRFVLEIISHEIKHVEQYMQKPILALSDPNQCPAGICDANRLQDTRSKMEYEFEAMKSGYDIGRKGIAKEEWEYTALWFEEHPTPFNRRMAFITRVPFEEIWIAIPDGTKLFYSAMYEPVILARTCAEQGYLTENEKKSANKFMNFNKNNKNSLERVYTYLTPVLKRLEMCAQ